MYARAVSAFGRARRRVEKQLIEACARGRQSVAAPRVRLALSIASTLSMEPASGHTLSPLPNYRRGVERGRYALDQPSRADPGPSRSESTRRDGGTHRVYRREAKPQTSRGNVSPLSTFQRAHGMSCAHFSHGSAAATSPHGGRSRGRRTTVTACASTSRRAHHITRTPSCAVLVFEHQRVAAGAAICLLFNGMVHMDGFFWFYGALRCAKLVCIGCAWCVADNVEI